MEKVNSKIASPSGKTDTFAIEYEIASPIILRAHVPTGESISLSDDDLFGALCKLRSHLEQKGYLLLCNAARKDAYPSRLAREMGGGRRIYLLTDGMHAKKEDLVDIFEDATVDQVCTVAAQRANYERWIKSLR